VHLLGQIGLQLERSGDYHRLLTEYHHKRLNISREIGYRPGESDALISSGQTQGIYLGDYEGGLALLREGRRIRESITQRVFGVHTELSALLRVIQILSMQGQYEQALETLESIHRLGEQDTHEIIRAGLRLVSAILYNAMGDERISDVHAHFQQVLELITQTKQLVADTPLTKQYEMAAACEATSAHLGLAQVVADEAERHAHLRQALESSQVALDIYHWFGFVQVIECVSEEILFRHSLALAANGREAEAAEYLQRAYDEMMRKHNLIPPDSPFRRTYLENIALHRDIRAAYVASRQAI
jgi:tetratricopeptide (TPR) repeat protein